MNKACKSLPALTGLLSSCESFTSNNNDLFKRLYRKYSTFMCQPQQMSVKYDAFDIEKRLNRLGFQMFGRLVFLTTTSCGKDNLFNTADILPKGIKKGAILTDNPVELLLKTIYKYRCAFFHGDFDINDSYVRETSEFAYKSLREICSLIL